MAPLNRSPLPESQGRSSRRVTNGIQNSSRNTLLPGYNAQTSENSPSRPMVLTDLVHADPREIELMDVESARSDSSGDSRSSGSAIPPSFEHPTLVGHENFMVYYEPRSFHRSPNHGSYQYLEQDISEHTARDSLMVALMPQGGVRNAIVHLQSAMVGSSLLRKGNDSDCYSVIC